MTRPSFRFFANSDKEEDRSGTAIWTYVVKGTPIEVVINFNEFKDAAAIQKMLLHTYLHGEDMGFQTCKQRVLGVL